MRFRPDIRDFLAQQKGQSAMLLLVLLGSNCLNVLLPLSIGWFYDLVFHEHSTKGKLLAWLPFQVASVAQFMWFFGALVVVKTVLVFFEKYLVGWVGESFGQALRKQMFAQQVHQSFAEHRKRPVGKYLSRYAGDLASATAFLTKGVLVFAGDVIFLALAFGVLFGIQWQLAGLILAFFGAYGGVFWLMGHRERPASARKGDRKSQLLDFVAGRLQAFYTLKSFNRETPTLQQFDKLNGRVFRAGRRQQRALAFAATAFPLFFYGALGAVMLWVAGAASAAQEHIHQSDVISFVLIMLYMRGVLRRVFQVNMIWQTGRLAFQKLEKTRNKPGEQRGDLLLPDKIKGLIELQGLSFVYPDGKTVFDNLNGTFLPDTLTHLRAGEGGGKSTLFKLIQKMYEPTQGRILLDKMDCQHLTPFEIRKHVSIVSGEAPLLGSTVFEAISYSATLKKRGKALEMLQQLQIQWTQNPEDTLGFAITDQGTNLSASERSMLQIARALLTRKKIMLLDNPFEHLDAHRKDVVVAALNKLQGKRTIVLITGEVPAGLKVGNVLDL